MPFILEGRAESTKVSDSIVTIKNALKPGRDKFGVRITSGNEATVRKLK